MNITEIIMARNHIIMLKGETWGELMFTEGEDGLVIRSNDGGMYVRADWGDIKGVKTTGEFEMTLNLLMFTHSRG